MTSVRTRIAGTAAVLAAIALTGAGLAVYLVQSSRLDEQAISAISVKMAEIARLQASGVDPATGQPFGSTTRLLKSALESNVPQDDEILIAFWDGLPRLGQDARSSDLSDYQPFVQAVDSRTAEGGSFRMSTPLGAAVVSVQAVQGPRRDGSLAVVYLLRPQHVELLKLMRTYAIVALLALLLVSLGAWLVASRLLRPLRRLRETAEEISHTDLTRRLETTGNDDLTELAHTVNAMLDRLEGSFTTNRQFLDDAGHELRTPITIVRGHLELVDPNNPADVAATRDLVLDEIDRMTRMVEDLIILSRADQPDFVRTDLVDGAALADDVLSKARAFGDRGWMLDSCMDGAVLVDAQRITQAMLQLCGNAVAHTSRGDEIALGFRIEDGRAYWWVRDTGTGIPADDTERIFDRFQRGNRIRATDAASAGGDSTTTLLYAPEGSGLGLAIVSAIMKAHDGDVSVQSAVGLGSLFTLSIPHPGAVTP